jgi:hypothetical protein
VLWLAGWLLVGVGGAARVTRLTLLRSLPSFALRCGAVRRCFTVWAFRRVAGCDLLLSPFLLTFRAVFNAVLILSPRIKCLLILWKQALFSFLFLIPLLRFGEDLPIFSAKKEVRFKITLFFA